MDKRQYSGAGPSATLLWQFLTFSKAILILLAFPQQGTLPVQWLTCEPELPLIQSKPCHLACGPKLLMSALFASFTAADILHLALIAHALLHLRQTEFWFFFWYFLSFLQMVLLICYEGPIILVIPLYTKLQFEVFPNTTLYCLFLWLKLWI